MGNCFGLFSTTPKPPADGAGGDPPSKEEPSPKEPPESGVVLPPVGEGEVVKKPLTPPSEHNGLPRVSTRSAPVV